MTKPIRQARLQLNKIAGVGENRSVPGEYDIEIEDNARRDARLMRENPLQCGEVPEEHTACKKEREPLRAIGKSGHPVDTPSLEESAVILLLKLGKTKAGDQVIVYHAGGLHESVADG